MQKMIVIDAAKCTGCRSCELVCSVKKEQMVNTGKARVHVVRFENIVFEVPVFCQQCADAPCKSICPVKAINWNDEAGRTEIDLDKCIGCKMCVVVCPFGAMAFDAAKKKVYKCDQCDGDPTCVKFCDTKAIQFVPVAEVNQKKSVSGAQKLSNLIPSAEARKAAIMS